MSSAISGNNSPFPSIYQEYIYKSKYARYLDHEKRREEWPETVDRYVNFIFDHAKKEHNLSEEYMSYKDKIKQAILNFEVMPSMRAMMTSGKALEQNHVASYNCSYLPVDSLKSFDETMMVIMNGTGLGFSVEGDNVNQLPIISEEFHHTNTTIIVEDSKAGWAKSFKELISLLYMGQIPKIDTSKVRPPGARLKTFGGYASGPQPLLDAMEYTINTFKRAAGRRLTTLECHDIMCMIGDSVIVGGVRRTAFISLSDLTDERMRDSKSGNWWQTHGHRRLANNSAVYEEKPEIGTFMREWLSLYESKSGERGIISRKALKHVINHSNQFRKEVFGDNTRIRDVNWEFAVNPCGEIILRPYQFCNLSEVIVRVDDTQETLKEKVKIASIIGTLQSCLTKFKYISKKWQKNCEDERLLGVSLTGIYDNSLMNGRKDKESLRYRLEDLKIEVIRTNKEWATALGINESTATTCIKPSGTVSALTGTASGAHHRHSPYYIRYVRQDLKDPLTQFMKDSGVPWEVDVYKPHDQVVFKFPIKSPKGAKYRKDESAIEHLELWKTYQIGWCEHKPSVTITVKEHEWLEVGAWVYKNFEWMSGVSFLPADDHVYKQAPFTECSKEEYEELLTKMPTNIDWKGLAKYEVEDSTTNASELACVAGGCSFI